MQTGLFARLRIITTSCWVKCINFNISEEKWMQNCGITAENICTELGHLFYLQDAKSHFLDSYCSISFGKVFGNKEKLVGNLISIRHRNGDGKNISVKKFHWLKKSCFQIPRKLFHSFFFSKFWTKWKKTLVIQVPYSKNIYFLNLNLKHLSPLLG